MIAGRWLAVAAALLGLSGGFAAPAARAHSASESFLRVESTGARLDLRWDIALVDLDLLLGLDVDGDRRLTWGEVTARRQDISRLAQESLAIRGDGQGCPAEAPAMRVTAHGGEPFLSLSYASDCGEAPASLEFEYALLFAEDPRHRGLFALQTATGTATGLFTPEDRRLAFTTGAPAAGPGRSDFGTFVRSGILHIWGGADHLLFLLSLLVPAVMVRVGDTWRPSPSLRDSAFDVARVVTAFTLGHSVTLAAAALGLLAPPERIVESVIAASVVLAAVNNVWPILTRRRWAVAVGFGLVHGFGFAGALGGLALPREALVASLLAFNLGVEIGQLVIVAAFLPVAFALRSTLFYRRWVLLGGSAAIAALGAAWLVERAVGPAWLQLP